MNIFGFLGILFLISFIFGRLLEKLRIPWIFAALLFGVGLSLTNPFATITSSAPIQFMSQMGLYLLLFLIGFELDISKIVKSGKFIVKATVFIEIAEMLLVGSSLHFLFSMPWFISMLLALSFATVGEAILLPMLDEFGLTKTRLGQLILGIATFDDVFEIFVIVIISVVIPIFLPDQLPAKVNDPFLIGSLLLFAGLLFFVLVSFRKIKSKLASMSMPNLSAVLPIMFAILFVFVGIDGSSENHIAVLGALFAGIVTKNLLPEKEVEEAEPLIKAITYGLFAPVFFLTIGLDTNVYYVISNFWLVLIILLIAKFAKIIAAYVIGRKELGIHQSIFMGVALGVRFSTSIVFLKILLDSQLITSNIYSVMIGTSIVFKFTVPIILAMLVKTWKLTGEIEKSKIAISK